MKTIIILVLILVIFYIYDYYLWYTKFMILQSDIDYFKKFYTDKTLDKLLNNNKVTNQSNKKHKILFLTYENRNNLQYVKIHNKNISEYCKKWNYKYKFTSKCNTNPYWCKIYLVLEALETGLYDYVVWLDSDTVIKDMKIDISQIINKYNSDIYIGSDNNQKFSICNSGVFVIKNSANGIKFLMDCINMAPTYCFNFDGSINGHWAASCYEQGILNLLISDAYSDFTTVLPNDIIFNYNKCSDNVFIMHLYASSDDNRVKCFQ